MNPIRDGAIIQLSNPEATSMTIEIVLTACGPVVRTAASSLELKSADEIVARCNRFAIEARDSVRLSARHVALEAEAWAARARSIDFEASAGNIKMRANDDVQLLGERILLNCERESALPSWLSEIMPAEVTLARQDAGGDLEIPSCEDESSASKRE